MNPVIKESSEVLYPANDGVVTLSSSDIDELKELAQQNSRRRIRFCTHRNKHNLIHEMCIVHTNECYVRPHRHLNKTESILILEGHVDLILFQENGEIQEVVSMGELKSGKSFYNRLDQPIFHTLIIHTPVLVFHEITQGPFRRELTEFPDWAPLDGTEAAQEFMKILKDKLHLN